MKRDAGDEQEEDLEVKVSSEDSKRFRADVDATFDEHRSEQKKEKSGKEMLLNFDKFRILYGLLKVIQNQQSVEYDIAEDFELENLFNSATQLSEESLYQESLLCECWDKYSWPFVYFPLFYELLLVSRRSDDIISNVMWYGLWNGSTDFFMWRWWLDSRPSSKEPIHSSICGLIHK